MESTQNYYNNNQVAYEAQPFVNPGYTPMVMQVPVSGPMGQPMGPQMYPQFGAPIQMVTGPDGSPVPLIPLPSPQMFPMQPMVIPPPASPLMFPMMGPSVSPLPMMPSVSPLNLCPSPSPPMTMQNMVPVQNQTCLGVDTRRFPSVSRSPSVVSESESGEPVFVQDRERSLTNCSSNSESSLDGYGPVQSSSEGPSKRELVEQTLGWMESIFGDRYDNEGTRGENVLRLKVKTVIALEHIVEFIERCNMEGLIDSISCPVSTKKGRQHIRGYLAYIKAHDGVSADRIESIFTQFNEERAFPFKTLHRNPASTL